VASALCAGGIKAFGSVAFVVGILGLAACLTFAQATLANPYSDVTRAWTTIFTLDSGVVSVGAWITEACTRW
jgi:hypothetical protein